MIHFLLTFAISQSQPISRFTEYLSPFDIFWPEDWQPSAVELSSNHAGEIVNLTLNCHIYQAVPKGAYIEISIQGFPNSPYNTTSAFDQPVEGDNRITFPNITLPATAGSYGPVSVVVRYQGPDSMLLAQSSSLTSIAVLAQIPKADPNLTISYAKDASRVISQTTTLTFSFVVNQDLYYNDYFVLDVDPNYGFQVINEGLIWDLANEDYKYFQNMKMKFDEKANQLIFYGFDTETNDATYFKVSVANVINPPAVINEAKPGKWKMTIYRFGTPTVKQRIYEPGQIPFPVFGKFVSVVWDFAFRSLDFNPLFKELTCYMALNITLGHDVPVGGTIEVVYSSSVDITKYSFQTTTKQKLMTGDSYVSSLPYNYLSCEIKSSTRVLCTVLNNLLKGNLLSIFNLVYFAGDSPGVDLIESKNDKGFTVDKLDIPITLSYNSNPIYLKIKEEDSQVYMVDASSLIETKKAGQQGNFGLAVSFKAENGLNAVEGSVFLSLPSVISTQTSATSFAFGTSVQSYLSSNLQDFNAVSYTTQIQSDYTSNKIILNTNIQLSGQNSVNILVKSSSLQLSLPLFPSAAGVMYEVDFFYRSLEKYYFDRKILHLEVTSHESSLKTFCKIKDRAQLPVLATVTSSFAWNWNSNYNVFIDFLISSNEWKFEDWSLNGEIQGSYPSSSSLSYPLVLSGVNKGSSGSEVHLKYELQPNTLISVGSKLSIIFPVPKLSSTTTIDVTSTILARQKSNGFNIVISKRVSDQKKFTFNDITKINAQVSAVNASDNLKNYTMTPSPSFTINHFFIKFAKGFDLTTINSQSYAKLENLNKKSSFSIIYSTSPVSGSSLKIEKIGEPWIKLTEKSIITFVDSPFNDDDCYGYSEFDPETSPKALNLSLLNSKSFKGLGASSLVETFMFALKSPGFFEGSSKSFLNLTLDEKVKNNRVWLDGVYFSFSSSQISCPITKDIQTDQLINLTLSVDLFEVASDQTINIIKEIFFEFNKVVIYKSINTPGINFKPGSSSSTSENMTLNVFPNTFNSTNVYFFLSFSSIFILPAGTNITIIGEKFQDDKYLNLDLWCTLGYVKPLIYEGVLSFVTLFESEANKKISIIKDDAFTIPLNNDNKTNFKVIASYNGFLILDDRKTSTDYIKYANAADHKLYMTSLNLDISNKGSESWHTFTFKIDTDTTEDWSYLFFMSNDYSAHGGVVFSYEELPDVYFLDSYSSLSKISCIVDHWVIICNGLDKMKANSVIDISLKLINPASNETKWEIYAFKADNTGDYTMLTLPIEEITAKFEKIPENSVDILLVDYTEEAYSTVNLTLKTHLSITLTAEDTLKILFPRPYTVEIYNPNQIVCRKQCSVSNSSNYEYCTVQENIVTFPINNEMSCKNNKIEFTIFSLFNPKNGGFTRDESSRIVTDYLDFSYWSEKFNIYIIKNSNPTSYSSSSYPNINSAYTGFEESASSLVEINGNQPIRLTAGTYSELIKISLKSGVLDAIILKFLATDFNNYKLKFNNQGVYLVSNDFVSTSFRVGIDEDSFDGFYYITWTIQETSIYPGLQRYQTPSKTQVQVVSVSKRNITVLSDITMNINSRSVLEIDLNDVSPFQDMFLILAVNGNCGITFEDKVVVIDSNSTKGYALIYSGSSEGSCEISYSLNNTKAFNKPSDTKVTVKKLSPDEADQSLTFEVISQNTVKVWFKSNQNVFVYWAFLSTLLYETNTTLWLQEFIKNNSQPLFGPQNQKFTLDYQILNYEILLGSTASDDLGNSTIRMMTIADKVAFYGLQYVKPSQNSEVFLEFNNLIANTSYTVVAYVEHVDPNEVKTNDFFVINASTNYYGSSATITVKLENDEDNDLVYSAVALCLNIPKNRIVSLVKSQRRLLVNKELMVLPSVRSDKNSSQVAKRLNENNFIENFNAIAKNTTLKSVTLTIDYDGIDSVGYGNAGYLEWEFIPVSRGLSFNFTLKDRLTVCCIVTQENPIERNLTSRELSFGYFQNGEAFAWKECMTVEKFKIKNITFWEDKLDFGNTEYFMTCLPCNLYPIIPHCLIKSEYSYYNDGHNSVSKAEYIKFISSLLFITFLA